MTREFAAVCGNGNLSPEFTLHLDIRTAIKHNSCDVTPDNCTSRATCTNKNINQQTEYCTSTQNTEAYDSLKMLWMPTRTNGNTSPRRHPQTHHRNNTTSPNTQCHLFVSAFRQLSTFKHTLITLLYILPNIIRVTKSRKIRWARHIARTEEKRGAYNLRKTTIWKKRAIYGKLLKVIF